MGAMTHNTPAGRWERLALELTPAEADAIEENVRDMGVESETDEFWTACLREIGVVR